MQTKTNPKKQFQLYESIVSKFLINLPPEQRKQQSRLSYHAQKAWYYYLDAVLQVTDDSNIKPQQKYSFFQKLRLHSPKFLNINPDLIISKLAQNKPTCGAIIMNQAQTKVLVIRNRDDKLGFPKGKWNQAQKPEDCAARQVYQQIGIYIHSKIDPTQRIQFLGFGNVPSIFFVVKGIKQTQKFTIDKKQICQVFWMNVTDVTKYIRRFVSKSKSAWKIYLDDFAQPKLTIQQFIDHFKPKDKKRQKLNKQNKSNQKKNKQKSIQKPGQFKEQLNPFLTFKLDKQKLMRVFAN